MVDNFFNFGQWLKHVRKERRLTRQAIANNSDGKISQQYIHAIESGKCRNIGSDKLQALAKGLDMPIAVLQDALFLKRYSVEHLDNTAELANSRGAIATDSSDDGVDDGMAPGDFKIISVDNDKMAPRLEKGDIAFLIPIKKLQRPYESGRLYVLMDETRQHHFRYMLYHPEQNDYQLLQEANSDYTAVEWLKNSDWRLIGMVMELRKHKSLVLPATSVTSISRNSKGESSIVKDKPSSKDTSTGMP